MADFSLPTIPATNIVASTAEKVVKHRAPKAPETHKTKTAASHPPFADMIIAAVMTLKDRKGSSLQAIKKYLKANYNVDGARNDLFIKRFLKSSVASGNLVQTKGTGASGSFKLGISTKAKKNMMTPEIKASKVDTKPAAKMVKKLPKKAVERKVMKSSRKTSAVKSKKIAGPKQTTRKNSMVTKTPAKANYTTRTKNVEKRPATAKVTKNV